MIVPSQKMLLAAAVVVVPLATAAGFVPAMAAPCLAALGVCALAAGIDAYRGQTRLDSLGVSAPASLKLTKGVAAQLPITIENRSSATALRLSAAMPEGVESPSLVEEIAAPPGASRFDWPCTGAARGEHPLKALHLEAASPFGLWLARGKRPVHCALRVYPNLRDRATAALFLRSAN